MADGSGNVVMTDVSPVELAPLVRIDDITSLNVGDQLFVVTTQSRKVSVRQHKVDKILVDPGTETFAGIKLAENVGEIRLADITPGAELACKMVLFRQAEPGDKDQYILTQTLGEVSVGDNLSVFAKILHAQDPTQLLIKQLVGQVSFIKGCITFGSHSAYAENIRLEQDGKVCQGDLVCFKVV